jgi:hypothetical protein
MAQGMGGAIFDTVFPGWHEIAHEAAVLAARNYGKALEPTSRLAGSIPNWRDRIDYGLIKEARGEFQTRFPTVDPARHAVAHPEFFANPDKNMVPPPFMNADGVMEAV